MVLRLRPLEISLLFRRQILMYKDSPRAVRVKQQGERLKTAVDVISTLKV